MEREGVEIEREGVEREIGGEGLGEGERERGRGIERGRGQGTRALERRWFGTRARVVERRVGTA